MTIWLFSCATKSQNDRPVYSLKSSETIEYIDNGVHKIQIVYSTLYAGLHTIYDTSIVLQHYKDALLLEEIHYNIENGDSVKWHHYISRYDSNNVLVAEIDSIDGSLRYQNLFFYDNAKLHYSEHLAIFPKYNETMELIGTDTMRSTVYSFYNNEGQCDKVMELSKNELASELFGDIRYDTTLTFNEFDERSNRINSVSLQSGDTTSITKMEYDQLNRETKFIDASFEFGVSTIKYEYDERGNTIADLYISDDFSQRTEIEYDETNRPIKRREFRP